MKRQAGFQEGTVPALINMLEDEERWRELPLPELDVDSARHLKELVEEARHRSAQELAEAREGSIAVNAAIPVLARALRDSDEGVRQLAAEALGFIGPAAIGRHRRAAETPIVLPIGDG